MSKLQSKVSRIFLNKISVEKCRAGFFALQVFLRKPFKELIWEKFILKHKKVAESDSISIF